MDYLEEKIDKILFRPFRTQPMTLVEGDGLLSTQSLTFGMREEIRRLIGPAIYAREVSERLSKSLKRTVDIDTSL